MRTQNGTVWAGPDGLVWVVGTGEDAENRFRAFMNQRRIAFPGGGIEIMDTWKNKGIHELRSMARDLVPDSRQTPLLVHMSREGRVRRIVWVDRQLEQGAVPSWDA
jgi:hypothetical protein